MLVTFPTKKLWYDHEYSVHRHRQSFSCYRCHEALDTEAAFRTHLSSFHTDYLNEKQLIAAVSAARSTMQNPIGDEKCPLCLKAEWTSVRAFTTHVGRHMEEIALASLPKDEDTDSEHEDKPQLRQTLEGSRIDGSNSSPSPFEVNGKGAYTTSAGEDANSNVAPTSNPSVPQNQQQIPPPEPMPGAGQFGDPNFPDQAFNLDFSGLETGDVLNDFDFDGFLNNTDDTINWG